MSHDSFPANPLSVDVLTEVTAQKGSIFCPSDDEEKDPSHTKGISSKEEHLAELQQKAFKSAAASLVILITFNTNNFILILYYY